MAKRRTDKTISLFPFLAVLVCTMGALILLLLVTTRRIRQRQQEKAADIAVVESISPTIKPPKDDVSVEEWVQARAALAAIQEHRTEIEQSLVDQRHDYEAALEKLEDDRRNLSERERAHEIEHQKVDAAEATLVLNEQRQLELLRQQAELQKRLQDLRRTILESEQKLESTEALAVAGEKLVSQRCSALNALREMSDQQREQIADSGVPETVIEFSNSAGTSQSPVIVDITAQGFLFPATQTRIRREDMDGISATDNPLLSGILASHRVRSGDSYVSQPYVLLLVRPGGTLDFYMAQRVLKGAQIHFGYELVTEDEVIAAAKAVDGEAEAVRGAVRNAVVRRDQYLAATSTLRRRITALRNDRRGRRKQSASAAGDDRNEVGRRMYGEPLEGSEIESLFKHYANLNGSEEATANCEDKAEAKALANVDSKHTPTEVKRFDSLSAVTDSRQAILSTAKVESQVEAELAKALAGREKSRIVESLQEFGAPTNLPAQLQGDDSTEPAGRAIYGSGHQFPDEAPSDSNDRRDGNEEFWSAMQSPAASDSHDLPADHGVAHIQPQTNKPVRSPNLDGQAYHPHDTSPEGSSRASSSGGRNSSMSLHYGGGKSGAGNGAASTGGLVSYDESTIYLDPQHYTIVGQESVRLHGRSIRRIAQTLAGQLYESSRQNSHPLAQMTLPSAKFVVSPGAHTLYLQLAAVLHDMNIPVGSIVSMDAHVTDGFAGALSAMSPLPGSGMPQAMSRREELP